MNKVFDIYSILHKGLKIAARFLFLGVCRCANYSFSVFTSLFENLHILLNGKQKKFFILFADDQLYIYHSNLLIYSIQSIIVYSNFVYLKKIAMQAN